MPYPAIGRALSLVKSSLHLLWSNSLLYYSVALCFYAILLHCDFKGFFTEMQSSQWKDLSGTTDLDQAPVNGRELMLVLNFTILA